MGPATLAGLPQSPLRYFAMATVTAPLQSTGQALTDSHAVLSKELRRLTRVATFVAILTSPSRLLLVPSPQRLGRRQVARRRPSSRSSRFRGLVDILVRRVIPWPSLFGTDDARLREEDIVNRRRAWTWRWFFRWLVSDHRRGHHDHLPRSRCATAAPARASSWLGTVDRVLHEGQHATPQPDVLRSLRLPGLLPVLRELPDLHGPAAPDGHLADPRLRAGRRRVGRQARPRPRPGRGEGGDPPRRHALAVGRGVRGRRRQARARPALPRRAGHRQDDDGEGDRDRVQLAVRLDPRLGLRRRPSSASTRSSSASSPARRRSSPASGAASASSSSTRSTPSACAASRSAARGGGGTSGTAIHDWTRPSSTGRTARINPSGDLIMRERGLARLACSSSARRSARSPYPGWYRKIGEHRQPGHLPGHGRHGRRRLALNQLLVTMDGIDNPPFLQARLHEQDQLVPRRGLHRPAPRRQGLGPASFARRLGARRLAALARTASLHDHRRPDSLTASSGRHSIVWTRILHRGSASCSRSIGRQQCLRRQADEERARVSLRLPRAKPTGARSTSSARRTSRSRTSTRRSPGRAGWAATSRSGRRRRKTARTSSTSTSARSPTTPTSTRRRAPRRDRPDHERLLAGDDRPDLLDGADERAPRGPCRTSPGSTSSTR